MTINEDMICAGIDAYYNCKNSERSLIYTIKAIYEAMSVHYYGEPKAWENDPTSTASAPNVVEFQKIDLPVNIDTLPPTVVNIPPTLHNFTGPDADLDFLAAVNLQMATGSGVTKDVDPVVFNTSLHQKIVK